MGRPKGQPTLTRQRIVDAALALVDAGGISGLSMRKLGDRLGVDPMSVYHYIPNKDALLRAVVEHVFAAMPVPSADGAWQQRVHDWATAYAGLALAHPNLVLQIVSEPDAVAVAAAQANESLYGALEASGLPPKAVVQAADLIVDYVNGSVLAAVAGGVDEEYAAAALRNELEARPAEQTAVQRRLLSDSSVATGRSSFEFGLGVILTGLGALL